MPANEQKEQGSKKNYFITFLKTKNLPCTHLLPHTHVAIGYAMGGTITITDSIAKVKQVIKVTKIKKQKCNAKKSLASLRCSVAGSEEKVNDINGFLTSHRHAPRKKNTANTYKHFSSWMNHSYASYKAYDLSKADHDRFIALFESIPRGYQDRSGKEVKNYPFEEEVKNHPSRVTIEKPVDYLKIKTKTGNLANNFAYTNHCQTTAQAIISYTLQGDGNSYLGNIPFPAWNFSSWSVIKENTLTDFGSHFFILPPPPKKNGPSALNFLLLKVFSLLEYLEKNQNIEKFKEVKVVYNNILTYYNKNNRAPSFANNQALPSALVNYLPTLRSESNTNLALASLFLLLTLACVAASLASFGVFPAVVIPAIVLYTAVFKAAVITTGAASLKYSTSRFFRHVEQSDLILMLEKEPEEGRIATA